MKIECQPRVAQLRLHQKCDKMQSREAVTKCVLKSRCIILMLNPLMIAFFRAVFSSWHYEITDGKNDDSIEMLLFTCAIYVVIFGDKFQRYFYIFL